MDFSKIPGLCRIVRSTSHRSPGSWRTERQRRVLAPIAKGATW